MFKIYFSIILVYDFKFFFLICQRISSDNFEFLGNNLLFVVQFELKSTRTILN